MTSESGEACLNPYFSIFESETRLIAGVSAAWGDLETGGALFGFLSHGRRPVVHLATPPCEAARHEHVHFADDVTGFGERARRLADWGGLQLVGTWHSHHELGLQEPSGGDRGQVQSITGRNGYSTWVEIITSHRALDESDRSSGPWPFWKRKITTRSSAVSVQLNTFFYADPMNPRPIRCPIKVIGGTSPHRQTLMYNDVLSEAALGLPALGFPRDRISYDSVEASTLATAQPIVLPVLLSEQIESLPRLVREAAKLTATDGLWVIALPVSGTHCLQVAYDRGGQHHFRAAYLMAAHGDPPKDITKAVRSWKRGFSLETIYRQLAGSIGPSVSLSETGRTPSGPPRWKPQDRERDDEAPPCHSRGGNGG